MRARFLIMILFFSIQLFASEYNIRHLDGGPAPEENIEGGISLSENLKLHGTLEFGLNYFDSIEKRENSNSGTQGSREQIRILFIPVVPVFSLQYKGWNHETTIKAGASFLELVLNEKSWASESYDIQENSHSIQGQAAFYYNIFTSLSGAYFKTSSTTFGFDIGNVYSKNYASSLYADSYSLLSPLETYDFTDKAYASVFIEGRDDKYRFSLFASPAFEDNFILTKGGMEGFLSVSEMIRLFSEFSFSLYKEEITTIETGDFSSNVLLLNSAAGIGIKPNKNWLIRGGLGYAGMTNNIKTSSNFKNNVAVMADVSYFMTDPELSVSFTFRRQLMDAFEFFGPADNIFIKLHYVATNKITIRLLTGLQIAEPDGHFEGISEDTKKIIFRLEPEMEVKVASFMSVSALYQLMANYKSYPQRDYSGTTLTTNKQNSIYNHTVLAYLRFFY